MDMLIVLLAELGSELSSRSISTMASADFLSCCCMWSTNLPKDQLLSHSNNPECLNPQRKATWHTIRSWFFSSSCRCRGTMTNCQLSQCRSCGTVCVSCCSSLERAPQPCAHRYAGLPCQRSISSAAPVAPCPAYTHQIVSQSDGSHPLVYCAFTTPSIALNLQDICEKTKQKMTARHDGITWYSNALTRTPQQAVLSLRSSSSGGGSSSLRMCTILDTPSSGSVAKCTANCG